MFNLKTERIKLKCDNKISKTICHLGIREISFQIFLRLFALLGGNVVKPFIPVALDTE